MNRPLRNKTINTNPTYLTTNESYVRTSDNQIEVLPNQSISVTANITARDNIGNTAYWILVGVFKMEDTIITMPNPPAIITINDDTNGLWVIDMTVDTTNKAGSIVFSGGANVHIVANIQTNEVTYIQ